MCKEDYGIACYKELVKTGKPFALAEFGPVGDIRTDLALHPDYRFSCADALDTYKKVIESGISFAYATFWSSWAQVKISLWNMGKADVLMNDSAVIDLDAAYKYFTEGKF